jgi:hypothetical protein
MASRWIETLKGKKHLRLASGGSEPARRPAHKSPDDDTAPDG